MGTVDDKRLNAVRAELSGIFGLLDRIRARAALTLAARGLFLGVWTWAMTMVVLGGLVLMVSMPTFARGVLAALHVGAIGTALWIGVIAPWRARRGRRVWAMYCEEHHRRLDKRLVTTVDLAVEPEGEEIFATNPVASMLLRETSAAVRQMDARALIDGRHIRNPLLMSLVPVAILGGAALIRPDTVGRLFTALYRIDSPVTALIGGPKFTVTALDVCPGDVEVPRGDAVTLQATVKVDRAAALDETPAVTLYNAGAEPTVQTMAPTEGSPQKYSLVLHNVQQDLRYEVALSGRVSPRFSVKVYNPPTIDKISTAVTPPVYTRAAKTTVDGRYIEALRGSEIELSIQTSTELTRATLSDDAGVLEGRLHGATATFRLSATENRQLKAVVTDKSRHDNAEPTTISIVVIDDKKPELSVKRPGADWSVHPIGEVDLRAEVSDDFGIQELVLEYQINERSPQRLTLYAAPREIAAPDKRAAGEYTLALETLGAQVGDVILYRFHASDGRPEAAEGVSSSQPYFVTIRPYEQRFIQGGGGESSGEGVPPPNQRQVIVATTRLIDRATQLSPEELATESKDVAVTQDAILSDTPRFLRYMRARTDLPDRAERVAHIEQAMEFMRVAKSHLEARRPREALAPANAALSHLIAASAGLPQAAPPSGAGGGSGAPMNLLGQKLDTERDKFEARSGLPPDVDKKIQEAIERTRSLSQRQKEFAETIRREKPEEGGGGGNGQGAPSASSQKDSRPSRSGNSPVKEMVNREEMLQQLEDARRELERLQDELLDLKGLDAKLTEDLKQALESAKSQMGRLANAVENGKPDDAEGANARAMEELNQLQLALEQAHEQSTTSPVEEMLAKISALREEQERVQAQTRKPNRDTQTNRGLPNRQSALAQDAQDFATQAASSAESSSPGPTEAAQGLASSAEAMQRAVKELEKRDDASAVTSQSEALAALEQAAKALESVMRQQNGQDASDLRQALAELQELKQALENPLTAVNASDNPGADVQTQATNSDSSPSQSSSSGPAPGDDAVPGGGGGGGVSQISRAPQNEPGGNDFTPSTSRGARLNGSALRVRLKTIEYLLAPKDIGTPLVQQLMNLAASDMWNAPNGSGGSDTQFDGEFLRILNQLEDIVAEEYAAAEQLHRLQQTPPEDLPEQFRELGARYFEALAEKRAAARNQK